MTDKRLSDQRLHHFVTARGGMYPNASMTELLMLADELQERRAADTRTPPFTADEMEAMRLTLHKFASRAAGEPVPFIKLNAILEHFGLPESVIAWVLGESPVPVCKFPKSCSAYPIPCPTCRGEQ